MEADTIKERVKITDGIFKDKLGTAIKKSEGMGFTQYLIKIDGTTSEHWFYHDDIKLLK